MISYSTTIDPINPGQASGSKSWLKWLSLAFSLMLLTEVMPASSDPKPGLKYRFSAKQKAKRFQQRYVEIAGGYGVWSKSWQAGMEPEQAPIDVSITYGKKDSPLGYQAGYMFNTAFSQDIFLFKPRNYYLAVKLSILEAFGQKSRVDPYALLGISGWEGVFTDNVYDGIITYQEKVEKDYGISAFIGTGITYQINRLRVGPQFSYFLGGHGYYLAGGFEKQKVSASHMSVQLKISYRFNLKNFTGCPTYK